MNLYSNINNLIAKAMKDKDTLRLETLKLIKNELVKKEKEGKEVTQDIENDVLNKMIAQHKDSIAQFTQGNRLDLAEKEQAELSIIEEYAPKQVSDDELRVAVQELIDDRTNMGLPLNMGAMKALISQLKEVYPSVNGKIVSEVLKANIQ